MWFLHNSLNAKLITEVPIQGADELLQMSVHLRCGELATRSLLLLSKTLLCPKADHGEVSSLHTLVINCALDLVLGNHVAQDGLTTNFGSRLFPQQTWMKQKRTTTKTMLCM